MTDKQRYKIFIEADAIIVPTPTFESRAEAAAWAEDNIRTGDLGPANVRGTEPTEDL